MNAELEAIRDAMDKDRPGGRDREVARNLAEAYIAANPDEFVMLQTMTVETLVGTVEVFRANGDEQSQWLAEAWLLHLFPTPQQVGGNLQPGSPMTNG
ncbi:hypothetical protein [Mycobacterium sp. DL440]|uniref:hypothetical protein n=1 Tax=Mycobacterium sp. DL440 TaxID=2675523 RepID=UPI00141FB39B|nr:hypothetical protein [Mycobacterium sp. DL440]